MILEIIIFALALTVIVKSADIAVNQVIKISSHYGLSDFSAGFILLAVSTSLPELFIGVISSLSNAGGITAGNVFGASIADLLLIMGIIIISGNFVIKNPKLLENAQMVVFLSFIPIVLALSGNLNRLEGLALTILFISYCFFTFKQKMHLNNELKQNSKMPKVFLTLALSLIALFISSNFLVDSTVKIALAINVPKALIAVSIISLGTTIPELASALSVAKKKRFEMAFGDLTGSVITNTTLVLGASALVMPLSFNQEVISTSAVFLVIAGLLCVGLASIGKKINKITGLTLILVYVLFLILELGLIAF